jgi:hypothetical protein
LEPARVVARAQGGRFGPPKGPRRLRGRPRQQAKEITSMTNKPGNPGARPKRLSKSKRIHKRRQKQAARKSSGMPV